jgi:mono/diheme cytochrome c family protein
MNARASLFLLIAVLFAMCGCNQNPKSGFGFRLPDGDANQGREVFLYMQCNQCHTIDGVELPDIPFADPAYVQLGGKIATVKTYGDLVTSIINPSHKLAAGYAKEKISQDGKSNMYTYNRHMTIQELIDLVAFLQAHYDVVPPQFDYRIYPH